MKRVFILGLASAALLAGAAGTATAQPVSDTISVTATNAGVFEFNISDGSFDFGDIDATGTLSSTGIPGTRNAADDGAVYTADGATTWTCRSAPQRTVRVFNASTASTINWGTADRLKLRVPATGLPAGSTSCGQRVFSTTGDGGAGACTAGNLVHGVTAGNGANSVTGNLDLEVEVLDTDGAGTNSWTVVLTATGS